MDIVDFTVGWYIEPEQPDLVFDICHRALIAFVPFWRESVPSALTLMKHFLEDASAYVEVFYFCFFHLIPFLRISPSVDIGISWNSCIKCVGASQ
ncbi:unnamed protein product [Gongylonema pulchrum]|uniref:Rab-GAP TBC domain-containing protein n=1 Tax=Gongylonema pulchrum TaxID=637853 RepID=A0A183EZT3_9BILA|nr:unnamed protein product [Gongylonema pulchrum]